MTIPNNKLIYGSIKAKKTLIDYSIQSEKRWFLIYPVFHTLGLGRTTRIA